MFKELLKDAWPIIEKFAPSIATAIGSPISGLMTTFVVSMLANKFGIKGHDFSALANAITNDSEHESKLKELEDVIIKGLNSLPKEASMPSNAEVDVKLSWDKGG